MFTTMGCLVFNDFKIIRPVVATDAIAMMDFFPRLQPTDMGFHHCDMFINKSEAIGPRMRWYSHAYIASTVEAATIPPLGIMFDN